MNVVQSCRHLRGGGCECSPVLPPPKGRGCECSPVLPPPKGRGCECSPVSTRGGGCEGGGPTPFLYTHLVYIWQKSDGHVH